MRTILLVGLFLMFACGLVVFAPVALAQKATTVGFDSRAATPSSDLRQRKSLESGHHFWERENQWLFAGVGAARAFDYFSTLNMRRRGRQEILLTNDAVDNHVAFASIEASAAGVSIGAAHLFHRYGHHKLERWTSLVHFGLATGGAVRNYCLKTAHRAPP